MPRNNAACGHQDPVLGRLGAHQRQYVFLRECKAILRVTIIIGDTYGKRAVSSNGVLEVDQIGAVGGVDQRRVNIWIRLIDIYLRVAERRLGYKTSLIQQRQCVEIWYREIDPNCRRLPLGSHVRGGGRRSDSVDAEDSGTRCNGLKLREACRIPGRHLVPERGQSGGLVCGKRRIELSRRPNELWVVGIGELIEDPHDRDFVVLAPTFVRGGVVRFAVAGVCRVGQQRNIKPGRAATDQRRSDSRIVIGPALIERRLQRGGAQGGTGIVLHSCAEIVIENVRLTRAVEKVPRVGHVVPELVADDIGAVGEGQEAQLDCIAIVA